MLKTYFNWSTGKDSAFALYSLLKDDRYSLDLLLTSVNKDFDRVSMHGLRRELLEAQIKEVNLPFECIELSQKTTMEEYESVLSEKVKSLKERGFTIAGFGDIFLEDLKAYRENHLSKFGIDCVFPLWKINTKTLLQDFLSKGFKTIVICINGSKLDPSFCGRIIDQKFIDDLPEDVDPCGENGEFHTFCFDGPIFKNPIQFQKGEVVKREYENLENSSEKVPYYFCDLLPK